MALIYLANQKLRANRFFASNHWTTESPKRLPDRFLTLLPKSLSRVCIERRLFQLQ